MRLIDDKGESLFDTQSDAGPRSTTRSRASACGPMMSKGQRPHPRHAHRHGGRLHDPANDDSVAEHVVVVIIPFAGGTAGRCASEDEVVALHRAPPTPQHAAPWLARRLR